MNSNLSYSPEITNSGRNLWFLVACELQIWQMTLKNNRAPLLCHVKHCVSFLSHRSNWRNSSETPNSGQNRRFFLSCATLKFDRWLWKTIGHICFVTSKFVHHFLGFCEFELELLPKNDIEIWQMTLKNNRAPLLCHFQFCASFHSHWWILT